MRALRMVRVDRVWHRMGALQTTTVGLPCGAETGSEKCDLSRIPPPLSAISYKPRPPSPISPSGPPMENAQHREANGNTPRQERPWNLRQEANRTSDDKKSQEYAQEVGESGSAAKLHSSGRATARSAASGIRPSLSRASAQRWPLSFVGTPGYFWHHMGALRVPPEPYGTHAVR